MAFMDAAEALIQDRRWTVEDLAMIDDDNDHYELVDGRIDVSPPPAYRHSRAQGRLVLHLDAACPEGFDVVPEAGVVLNAERTHFRVPDIGVVGNDPVTTTHLERPPALAVEIISPDSAFNDHHTKRREYADFGIPSYWIVNPSPELPGLIEFRLEDSEYREVARAVADDVFHTDTPFPITLVPRWLVADGPWRQHIGGAG